MKRDPGWNFRRGFGLKDFIVRIVFCVTLFCIVFWTKPGTPRGREDKEWLVTFSLIMIIFFVCIHSIAYFPQSQFTGKAELWDAGVGRIARSYQGWNEMHWCAFIIMFIVGLYPFLLFGFLIYDGFNPYDELTA